MSEKGIKISCILALVVIVLYASFELGKPIKEFVSNTLNGTETVITAEVKQTDGGTVTYNVKSYSYGTFNSLVDITTKEGKEFKVDASNVTITKSQEPVLK